MSTILVMLTPRTVMTEDREQSSSSTRPTPALPLFRRRQRGVSSLPPDSAMVLGDGHGLLGADAKRGLVTFFAFRCRTGRIREWQTVDRFRARGPTRLLIGRRGRVSGDWVPLTDESELLQVEAGANTVGDKCRAEVGGHGVLSPPSGAVCGDEHTGMQGGEVVEHAGDQGLEHRSVEMKSA